MIGVRSGTTSSRGVRAVSWKRRRESVASGLRAEAVIGCSPSCSSREVGEAAAGEAQIDVVERGAPGADRVCETQLVDGGDRVPARMPVEGDGHGGSDREGV